MKQFRSLLYLAVVFLMAVTACAPKPIPTEPPPPIPATDTPALVSVPTEAAATATLVPIVLTGPDMKVGSTYPYVDGTLLVAVPGGAFTMGHGGSDNPEHTVSLSDFWIYSTKVTNQEYAFCVTEGQCTPPDLKDNATYTDFTRLNDPVSGITYDQSAAYCSFVHGRLPTEAEWEKTARGPDANIYPWGNNAPVCDLLNFNNCVGKTTSVIKYPQGASYYSALDMEGNTFEWVADWYDALFYKTSAGNDPIGPDKGTVRSVRSTGYKALSDQVPASTRFFANPNDHRRDLGFRCVVDDPTWFAPFCNQPGFSNGTVQYDCPKLSITSQAQSCKDGWAQVNIHDSFGTGTEGDGNSNLTLPAGCSQDAGTPGAIHNFDQGYKCTKAGPAKITSICSIPLSGNVHCAPNYNLNTGSGLCEWSGKGSIGTQCLAGFAYDPQNQFCSAAAGSQASYPVCSAGSTLVQDSPGHYVCLLNSVAPPPPAASVNVVMPAGCNQIPCDPATDPTCQNTCPNGGTYTCTPDYNNCQKTPTGCYYPPVCSCQ